MDAVHKAALALVRLPRRQRDVAGVSATANTDASTASHTTPAVNAPSGAWVVSAWSEKGANTQWTFPATVTARAEAYTTASGAVSKAVADPGVRSRAPCRGPPPRAARSAPAV